MVKEVYYKVNLNKMVLKSFNLDMIDFIDNKYILKQKYEK